MTSPRIQRLALVAAALLAGCSKVQSVTAPSREEHSQLYFPIATGDHAGATCSDCHHEADYPTFRMFDCVGCHTDPAKSPGSGATYDWTASGLQAAHAEEPGFPDISNPDHSVPSADCYMCHADGTREGMDPATHLARSGFPIGEGTAHAAQKCGDCHASTSDRSQQRCAECHTGADADHPDTLVRNDPTYGYARTTEKCLRCHVNSQVDRVAGHSPFAIVSGAPHAPYRNALPSEGALCLKCHHELRADEPRGADFRRNDCFPCHDRTEMDGHHAGEVAGYAADKCLTCHPDGRKHDG